MSAIADITGFAAVSLSVGIGKVPSHNVVCSTAYRIEQRARTGKMQMHDKA